MAGLILPGIPGGRHGRSQAGPCRLHISRIIERQLVYVVVIIWGNIASCSGIVNGLPSLKIMESTLPRLRNGNQSPQHEMRECLGPILDILRKPILDVGFVLRRTSGRD